MKQLLLQDTFSTLKKYKRTLMIPSIESKGGEYSGLCREAASLSLKMEPQKTLPLHIGLRLQPRPHLSPSSRVDGSVASAAFPSTVTLDVRDYVDDATMT